MSHPLNKYIVQMGWGGFGDRTQALCYCMTLAKTRNRALVVNWEDVQFSQSFHDFFHIIDLPYAYTVPDAPTYPRIFRHLRNQGGDWWIYELKDYRIDTANEQVIVHSGRGFRSYNWKTLITHLRFTPQTAKEVLDILTKTENLLGDLPLVHLRGTDRAWKAEDVHALAENNGIAGILSDDKRAVDAYMSVHPQSVVINTGRDDGKPLHKTDPSRDRNIKMLADFCLLSKHGTDALNKESLFWRAAKKLGTSVDKWFIPAGKLEKWEDICFRSKYAT